MDGPFAKSPPIALISSVELEFSPNFQLPVNTHVNNNQQRATAASLHRGFFH
jgi:hypothetical protein